ncbi:hypothetical protein VNO77_39882 [Canavalia gladiata]|uniref:Uncharacterized protein n=1 Tax=Canavalia gladiata TaxID=3824 RepID=A0AAN9JZJ0_CANGL
MLKSFQIHSRIVDIENRALKSHKLAILLNKRSALSSEKEVPYPYEESLVLEDFYTFKEYESVIAGFPAEWPHSTQEIRSYQFSD